MVFRLTPHNAAAFEMVRNFCAIYMKAMIKKLS